MALYTFRNKRLTLNEAIRTHQAVSQIADHQQTINDIKTKEEFIKSLAEIWDTLVGTIKDADRGMLSKSVSWTMPKKHIPIMHLGDCIAASYAFKCIFTHLTQGYLDRNDDLAVREAMRKAWIDFDNRRLAANHIEEGFGCDESASWHTLRDIHDTDADGRLSKKMEEIAKLAGRMFKSFNYTKATKESDDPQSVKKATIGGDVERLVPSEMVKLGTESTKDITSMKVLKKEAQQFEMKGVREKLRGPLVILIDESGSMHDLNVGFRGRNCWAKACAVALTRIAWSENRPVVAVHFGMSAVVQDVPKDDYNTLFEMARSFMSGGTNFGVALDKGCEQVKDLDKRGYKGADVLIITDGEEHNIDQQNRVIDKLDKDGIKLWTIVIAGDVMPSLPIRKRAEKYICVQNSKLYDNLEKGVDEGILDGFKDSAMSNEDN